MLSKNKIKYIRSLELKKNRKQEQAFLAEGNKLVGDLLGIFPCRLVVATGQWLEEHAGIQADEVYEVSREELSKVSLLKTPQEVLAVFGQPEWKWTPEEVSGSLCLALDDVQDPGNLGLPTGLVLSMYSAPRVRWIFTIRKRFRLRWGQWPA